MILPIQSLRGIFAILIFVHHYTINTLPMIDAGNISVVFFIMLSGAMLTLGYNDKILSGNFHFRKYMRDRLARLYPVYLLTLILAIILLQPNHSPSKALPLLTDFFMIQGWIPSQSFYFSGNPPSWCMADFLFFYIIFPPLCKCLALYRKTFLSIFLLILALYFLCTPLIPENLIEPLTYISPLFRSIDFIIGMIIGSLSLLPAGKPSSSILKATLLETFAVILTLTAYYFQDYALPLYNNASWWWIPVALLIIVFARNPFGPGLWSRLLSMGWLVKFGECSYSFFLVGYLVIISVKLLILHLGGDIDSPCTMLVPLVITIPVSFLLYRKFEIPMARVLKNFS